MGSRYGYEEHGKKASLGPSAFNTSAPAFMPGKLEHGGQESMPLPPPRKGLRNRGEGRSDKAGKGKGAGKSDDKGDGKGAKKGKSDGKGGGKVWKEKKQDA